ncbi:BTAD domain-containing putative transcriptional regulator [Actinoplanes rectilineatus]|uniref:BTAD domain-containing putative transcriptional regulator n=1 Tax=Actinoplanes rectilineatus TaxID=113571 RepID=UPI0005F28A97|nr:BTAD domain-containing putative transcriptional regulator [Actinoplanes rectilineatus]
MDSDDRLRVTLLGAFRVSRGGVVLPVAGVRLQGLLVRLALAGGHPVHPDVLIAGIWGPEPPSDPVAALQNLVSRLRRVLVVEQVPGGYRLAVDPAAVDALRFERLAATGRQHLRAGEPGPAAAALAEAVALWGDEPAALAAVAPTVATRLARLSVEAVTDLADAEVALGRTEQAATRLAALLTGHPGDERAAGLLMDALAAQGRQAEALAVYQRIRAVLADTLGADPDAALRERHGRLLRGTASENPVPRPVAGLPAPVTGFVGRDGDLARIDALLAAGRLVTVVGSGGVGKTRLALTAAHRRRHGYAGGARLVDLSAVTEPAKVAAAVLAGIGRPAGRMFDARRHGPGDDREALLGELAGREILLLIDNCEHLIDAVAHLASALLTRCPGLRILATSREPLAVDGEALVPLHPLAVPGPGDTADQARTSEAVRLFTARAAAVSPGFTLDGTALSDVVRVVRGLDGLPLALELAAARLRTLSLPALADGLSDRFRLLNAGNRTAPARHRTLHAVIAWSWDLLDEHERVVAERIAVLPGGVTPASAVAVCAGTGVPAADIPALLSALVDRSLLQLAPEAGRFRMLETIREYGAAHATGTTRDLAAGYLTALTARLDPHLRGPGQREALRTLDAEHDNALAALRHRCATGDAAGAVTLTLNLTWYWQMTGRHADAAHWLGAALAVPGDVPTSDRDDARAAHLLNRADHTAGTTAADAARDRDQMRDLAVRLTGRPGRPGLYRLLGPILLFLHDEQSALTAFERLAAGDDVWTAGMAHMFLAEIAESSGRLDQARGHVEESLDRFRRSGDRWAQAALLATRARNRRYDDLDGALDDLDRSRTMTGEFGVVSRSDQFDTDLLGIDLHLRRGDTGRAATMIDAARDLVSSPEMRTLIAAREAVLLIRLGELDRARQLLTEADRDCLEPGGDAGPGREGAAMAPGDRARTAVGSARVLLRLALGDPLGAENALRDAYAAALATRELPVLAPVAVDGAALAVHHGRHHRAAVLLGAAARLRGTHDRTDPQVRDLSRSCRTALGDGAFVTAYTEGWNFDTATAVSTVSRPAGAATHR